MKKYLICLLLPFVMASCNRFEGNGPKRIICLSPKYNEAIFELGAQKDIVAIDASSNYPSELKNFPVVGYNKALNKDTLLAYKPTLIIHDLDFGPKQLVKQLKSLKIPMKAFSDSVYNIYQDQLMIRELGAYFDRKWQADSLCNKLDADMAKAAVQLKQYKDTPKVAVIHFEQANNTYLIMTGTSIAANIIKWAGGVVPVMEAGHIAPLSAQVISKANPDVILVTDKAYNKLGTLDKIKELPGIAGTNAALNNRIYKVMSYDILYLGARTGENVLKFQELIHTHTGQ